MYKRLTPCIFIERGKAVQWFDDRTVIADDVMELARHYNERGADELIIFDLSDSDEEHDETINFLKQINRAISIPMVVGGNIRRAEDVKKILYAGAKRAMLNFSKALSIELIEEVSKRFGKERIAVSLNDFDALFKQQHLIEAYSTEMIFMHRLDLNSVVNVTETQCVVVTDTMDENEILNILKSDGVKGISGRFISRLDMDFNKFKEVCAENGIQMTSFESQMDFGEFKLNSDGLIPVIVQDYKTNEVLMMAYMNQYVKSLAIDCDRDTMLAKVEQIGAACHTGNRSCFYTTIVGNDYDAKNPVQIFESVYQTIADRKENPKEGSYTNYLFEKGLDKILKKVGEEATEVVIAAKNPNVEEVKYELSDFLYHAMVLMVEKGITWEDITGELADR